MSHDQRYNPSQPQLQQYQPYQPYGQPQQQYAQAPPPQHAPSYGGPPPQYSSAPGAQPVPQYQAYYGGGGGDIEKQQQPLNQPRVRTSSLPDESSARFEYARKRCNDWLFAVLFVLHLIGVVVLIILTGRETVDQLNNDDASTPVTFSVRTVIQTLIAAAAAAGVFAALWLAVMKRCSDVIIKFAFFVNIAMLLVACAGSIAAGFFVGAIIFGISAAFTIMYYCFVRDRIPFTQAVIRVSLKALQTHPGPVAVTYGLAVLQVGWFAMWSFATLCVYRLLGAQQTGVNGLVYFLVLISLYWTAQVLKNVGHVTTAGTVATWWLVPTNTQPTCGSLKRACTTSFGSICFGSLVVAVLEATRAVLQRVREQAHRSNNMAAVCLLCCAECVLSCVERLIEFMNKYAYTQIAIYGKDFISAAKDTWELFKARSFDLLINDDLTGVVLSLGCILGGLVAGAVGGAMAYYTVSADHTTWQVLTGISFALGLAMTSLVMSVVESAVATTYVVWAQCPNELAQVRPEEFGRLRDATRGRHPDCVF